MNKRSTPGRDADAGQTQLELFIGKGGVGKTTLAAATAATHARAGERVLLVSIDQAHSLSEVLAVPIVHDIGTVTGIQSVAPGLDVIEIDSVALLQHRYREFVEGRPLNSEHRHGLNPTGLDPAELTGLPGAQELLALSEIHSYVSEEHWDTVIVDCGPTADLLRTLAAPQTFLGYLERLWPRQQRMTAMLGGDPQVTVLATAAERIAGAVAPVRELLADAGRTCGYLVTSPEQVSLAEAARTRSAAALLGLRLSAVVMNKVLPQLDNDQTGGKRAADPVVRWYAQRRREQQELIVQLDASMPELPTVVVHHAGAEPVGLERLTGLAGVGELLRTPTDSPSPAPVPTVSRESGQGLDAVYALRMYLPMLEPDSLQLGLAGDELVVGVDGRHGRVPLTPVLRRCVVAGAELDGQDLVVRFRPDPEVWTR